MHRDGTVIRIAASVPAGTNVRRRGEDIRAGNELIAAGQSWTGVILPCWPLKA